MAKAIRFHAAGGPDVLRWEDVEVGDPEPGEVRLKQTGVGLNYIDTYHRTGLYPVALPSGIGLEGAGVIEAVGEGVAGLAPGDRVAYAGPPIGAYATARVMPAAPLVKIPDGIDDVQAAGMMLQGMTARYLIRQTFRVERGMTVLFHAAAGGVGLIACQWLNHLGATVIGTVGSPEKADLARARGCHHPIDYSRENFVDRVREITDGKGVPVVYDGVGKDTWDGSLDCLARRGMLVSFGNASGPVAPFAAGILAAKGSLFLTRPTLMDYTATRPELEATAADLFDVAQSGAVKIEVRQTYALADAVKAHTALEGRKTTGSTVLLP